MGYSSWFVRAFDILEKKCFGLLVVMHQTLSQPTVTRRVGMTNVTYLRRRWPTAGFLDIALVRTTVAKKSTD